MVKKKCIDLIPSM